MAAYLIADVNVIDPVAFDEYRQRVPATEQAFGGRYLARGGATKVLEGEWDPHRLVVVEFPDMSSLLAWYDSPEYAPLKAIREKCADTRIIALEGIIADEMAAMHSKDEVAHELRRLSKTPDRHRGAGKVQP